MEYLLYFLCFHKVKLKERFNIFSFGYLKFFLEHDLIMTLYLKLYKYILNFI